MPRTGEKTCLRCQRDLPADAEHFHRNHKAKDGLASSCKKCILAYQKRHYKTHRRKGRYVYRGDFWVASLANGAARRAKKYGLPYDRAAVEACLCAAPDHCPALGLELHAGGRQSNDSPTLDRIIPAKGYVEGNIQVISNLANKIKSSATPEQVMAVARFMQRV